MVPAWVCGGLSAGSCLAFSWLYFRHRQVFGSGHSINPLMALAVLVWFMISAVGILLSIIVLIQECRDDFSRLAALKRPLLALVLNVVTNPILILGMLP